MAHQLAAHPASRPGQTAETARAICPRSRRCKGCVTFLFEFEALLAFLADGTVWIWSRNDNGQLGAPVQVPALGDVIAIAAGSSSMLAVKRDGTVWSLSGGPDQLGEEWIAIRSTPVMVVPLGAPDLTIAMTHDGDFKVGDEGLYKLTITNVGLTAASGMITVTDTLPRGVTWIRATANDWGCSAADQVVTCMSPVQIAPMASSSIGLTVKVGSAAWPGATNLAVVSNESDRNTANNAGWDPTVVLQGESGIRRSMTRGTLCDLFQRVLSPDVVAFTNPT